MHASSNHLIDFKLAFIYFIYLIASTAIFPLSIQAGYTDQIDCARLIRRSQCECFHEYIKCGPITLNTNEVLSQIRCNTSIEVKDYELLPNLRVGNLTSLTMTNCPFPDKFTVKDALQRLGITDVAVLKIQNGFDVTDGHIILEQQHYEDFPGFKQLALYRFRQTLPENYFFDCKNINELILSGYSDIPANVLRPLESLEKLKILVQNIGQISGELFSMQHFLKELDLDCTMEKNNENMSVLSGVMLSQMAELRKLRIRYCGDTLPRILFKQNSKLENICIYSDVKSIDKELLSKQVNLLTLNLAYNKLTTLHLDFFKNTPKLRELQLAHNKFSSIPSKLFDNLKYMQVLNLESNPLVTIDPKAFIHLRGKIYIDKLYDNAQNGELKLQTEAMLCNREYIFGVCRFCKHEDYLAHFGDEKCQTIET